MTQTDSSEATTPSIRELTVRGVVLGGVITLVFTAANVYLGLKVGLTFATAIPAAVISMAILRYFRGHTILENNIVQTIASAAGTLAAIIFVLPGLIMIGWWTGFPYWITVAVCIVGGILGVMYSVPLRRALVTGSDLPYPEGVAAAEVLKVGEAAEDGGEGNRRSLRAILVGSLVAAGFSLLAATKAILSDVSTYFRLGAGGSMVGASLSLALIGVGHLVGVTVGFAMIVGLVISYFVLLPTLTWGDIPGGADVAGHRVEHLLPRRAIRRRGCHRRRGDLDAAQDPRPDRPRHPGRGRLDPRAPRRRTGGADRTGPPDLDRRRHDRGIADPHRTAAVVVPRQHGDHRQPTADHRGDPGLRRAPRRHPRVRRGVHGRPDRLVQQPDLRTRHSGRRHRLAGVGAGARPQRRPRADAGAGGLRAVRHRDRVRHRHHLQRQPAGPQDRPAGRRHTVAAAGRAGHRRRLRRPRHSRPSSAC